MVRIFLALIFILPTFVSAAQLGTISPEVKLLQEALNERGYSVTNYGEETTFFGPQTEAALVRYQIDNAAAIIGGQGMLNTLGVLDPLTSSHLMSKGEVLGASTDFFGTNLTPGMQHDDVRGVQAFLNTRGYVVSQSGPGSMGEETTYYGPGTKRAVKAYQEANADTILVPNGLSEGTGLLLGSTRMAMNRENQSDTSGITAQIPTTAVLAQASTMRTLTITLQGNGIATTSTGQTCSVSPCVLTVPNNATISITARPNAGANFTRWSGACSGTARTCRLTMSRNRSVTATFTNVTPPAPRVLTTAVSGQGSITGTGISCGTDCSETYTATTSVALTATPAAGYRFSGWSGACTGTATTCTVVMSQSRTVTASFAPSTFTLSVSRTGQGTVTGTGISCGTDCSEVFTSTTTAVLTATPAAGYTFSGWSGACTGTGTCSVLMSQARSVGAVFTLIPLTYTLTTAVTGQGTITGTGISCGTDCTETYTASTSVVLTATPAAGYTFSGWSGACTGTASTCTVVMSGSQSVSAGFGTGGTTSTSSNMTYIDTSFPLPVGRPGVTQEYLESEDGGPRSVGTRDTFRSFTNFTHFNYDDPIIFPGVPGASHLHMYFGNSRVNASTTAANIRTNCSSASSGGTANCSAYWMPAIIDGSGRPVVPNREGQYDSDAILYYKAGYGLNDVSNQQAAPAGLRMIAGTPAATPSTPQDEEIVHFVCYAQPSNNETARANHMITCPQGSVLEVVINFPQCWDGVNLDSANHKSHMAYPAGGNCPATHPVNIPAISLIAKFNVMDPNGTQNWRLSSDMYSTAQVGGYSLHSDWFNGWNQAVMERFVQNCNRAEVDCVMDNLNDGQKLMNADGGILRQR
jgi:uncharacterized repeat protein (TIGR02543 family)